MVKGGAMGLVVVACALAAGLAGCTAGGAGGSDGTALGVVPQDDLYYDDDGSVLIVQDEDKAVTPAESLAFSGLCEKLTIVGVDILPDGRIGAVLLETGPLDLEPGQVFYCNALYHDGATGKLAIDFDAEGEECCQMKAEYLDGITRLSCSGDCDNGGSCGLKTEVDPQGITILTCACPDTP